MRDPKIRSELMRFSDDIDSPLAHIGKRAVFTLPVELIHPYIRIAHRQVRPAEVDERIIVDFEIVLLLAGNGFLEIDGQSCPYAPYDLLFIPPFIPHRFIASDRPSGEHIAVHFDLAPSFPNLSSDLVDRTPYEIRLTHGLEFPRRLALHSNHPIETSLLDILRDWRSDRPQIRLAATIALTSVLITMLQLNPANENADAQSGSPNLINARVHRVMDYVNENYDKHISAGDLVTVAGVGISRLHVLFRETVNLSPSEYVRRVRVDKARRLLEDVDLSIQQVAYRTGFANSYHFSRVFRQIDGISPSHYREAVLATRNEANDD